MHGLPTLTDISNSRVSACENRIAIKTRSVLSLPGQSSHYIVNACLNRIKHRGQLQYRIYVAKLKSLQILLINNLHFSNDAVLLKRFRITGKLKCMLHMEQLLWNLILSWTSGAPFINIIIIIIYQCKCFCNGNTTVWHCGTYVDRILFVFHWMTRYGMTTYVISECC